MPRRCAKIPVILCSSTLPLVIEAVLLHDTINTWLAARGLPYWLLMLLALPQIAAMLTHLFALEAHEKPRQLACTMICAAYAAGAVWPVCLFLGDAVGLASLWQAGCSGLLGAASAALASEGKAGCIISAAGSVFALAASAYCVWLAAVC